MVSAPEESNAELHERQLFVAGLTPFEMFNLHAGLMADMVAKSEDVQEEGEIFGNHVAEVCLIGLVAHFEAFCKHQFAALVNICPTLLEQFASKRQQSFVKLKDLICLTANFDRQIGFLIAEQHDFGSAKSINGLFRDLLCVTPFSNTEGRKYDQLLNDRHLLVHHAGVYTLGYASQRIQGDEFPKRLFIDSIIVSRKDYQNWDRFLNRMVLKIVRTTTSSIRKFVEQRSLKLGPGRRFALEYLLVGIDISITEILRLKEAHIKAEGGER